MASVLGLIDEGREAVEEYIDDTEEPLSGIIERWKAALEKEGRIPFRAKT
jgi:hypothetical protein